MVLGALAVMIVNDHWGKQRFHNAATGKVSDVAGVFALPLVVVALVELTRWVRGRSAWRCRRGALAVAVAGTGLGFAATKLVAGVGAAYVVALGGLRWLALTIVAPATGGGWPAFPDVQLVADLTDLLVLPVLLLTWLVGIRSCPRRSPYTATFGGKNEVVGRAPGLGGGSTRAHGGGIGTLAEVRPSSSRG